MKRQTKKLSFIACAAVACGLGAFGVAFANPVNASAVTTNDNVNMLDSASLRTEQAVDNVDIPFGLRFKTEVNKAWYDGLTNAQVYTLLLPSEMLGENELTAETADKVTTADLAAKAYEVGDNYRFNAVLTSIPAADYGTEITARTYIVANEGTYYSATTVERSVAQVADAALTFDYDTYAPTVGKYLVKELSVNGATLSLGETANINAAIGYFDEISDENKTKLDEKYTLTYSSSNQSAVTVAEDGTLTTVAAGESEITVSCEELDMEKTVTVSVVVPTYGQLIDFTNIDESALELKAENASTSKLEIVDNAIAVSISKTDTSKIAYFGFTIAKPDWFYDFDTVTVSATLEDETNASTYYCLFDKTDAAFESYWLRNEGDTINATAALGEKAGDVGDHYGYLKNDPLRFFFRVRDAAATVENVTIHFTDIQFGFDPISSTGEAVNLYTELGVTSENATFTFTPTDGTATTIADPANFLSTESGTVSVTITKAGYNANTFDVAYTYTYLPTYGQLIDFTDIDTSLLSAFTDTNSYGTMGIDNGQQAIWFTIDHTEEESGTNENSGVSVAAPAWIGDFDTVSATFVLYKEDGDTGATWKLYNQTDTGYVLNNTNDSLTVTRSLSITNTYSSNKLHFFAYLRQNKYVASAKILITDIKFGFNDITLTAGDSVSIIDTLGYTAEELGDSVTFNGAAVADLAAFAPTESGTLSFTVNKEGYKAATFTVNVVVNA